VSVDVKALRHVLMNILGNAIKFTPQGGCIKIQTRDLNQEISISVSDTGAGMPTADLELLFADVWPGSSGHRALESSGLGLYLCAKIMAAHNGRITCTSELGAGTTFTLFLPKVEAKR
jgi:signal transduction histidine kinase